VNTFVSTFWGTVQGRDVLVLNKVHLYFGVYSGAVKTVDKEAKGVLLYSLEELEKEMIEFPTIFTDDLRFLIKQYRPQIVDFIKSVKTK